MPIRIDASLPAKTSLESENIFVMTNERASTQDIRPLKILILNLMPTKITTETQLLRLLSNTPIQVEIELLQTATHQSTHTSAEHMLSFYKPFDEIKNNKYDGMVVTGAPVEKLEFEEVDYWNELCQIFDWADHNVYSTFHICWGAQAGLFHRYGLKKHLLDHKVFGIFKHRVLDPYHPLLRGFDEEFYVPHSRYTEVRFADIALVKDLQTLSYSPESGVHLLSDMKCRNFYSLGHSEYDRDTLKKEYLRDKKNGLNTPIPINYFPNDDPTKDPVVKWRGAGSLMFSNWLNYFVYQQTPYDLSTSFDY